MQTDPGDTPMLRHPEMGIQLDYRCMVDGWTYGTFTDEEDDNRKLWHYLICDEAVLEVEWTPYHRMTTTDIHAWLTLGCPKRQGIRPLNTLDLLHLATERVSRAA